MKFNLDAYMRPLEITGPTLQTAYLCIYTELQAVFFNLFHYLEKF